VELQEKYPSEITEDLTSILTSSDVLLSNQTDDNGVTAICAPCYVVYRQPNAEDRTPEMPNDTFVCRYSLDFEGDSVDVTPYEGEDDDWRLVDSLEQTLDGDDDDGQRPGKRRRHEESQDENSSLEDKQQSDDGTSDDDAEEEEDGASVNSGSEDSSNNTVDSDTRKSDDNDSAGSIDGEGSTEKRNTRIGSQHQAVVPKFVLNQRVIDRNPTLVWEPGNISEDDLDRYFELAANILTPFLRQNELTDDDPYSPLPMEQMESEAKRANGAKPTLSAICTASSLSLTRNNLLRECNADALLDILSQSDYSVSSAVNAIKASPRDFLTAWSPEEKEIFNSGFRRYSGSLRMISKGIAPTKDFKDVIDYHYRFKVPDQFRRFQDKKREQAVRMIECIETRRYIDNVIHVQNERGTANENGGTKRGATGHW
jgi:hypothetical protein